MTPRPDEPRPQFYACVPPLADAPLDGGGVAGVERFSARTTGPVEHAAAVELHRPILHDGRAPQTPSLVLPHPPALAPAGPAPGPARVRFEWDGQTLRAQVPLPVGARCFGLGENAGPLERTGRLHRLWNTDAWSYGEGDGGLYQSHPWVLTLLPGGRCLGILADTPRRGLVACAADGVELAFEAEPFDVLLVDGAHPAEVVAALAALVGPPDLPPLWALGYHQCRWSYMDEDEVRQVARRLRAEGVPCDGLWFDIDYMDRWRVFTWDGNRFPDPPGLIEELGRDGFHAVAILDPGVAVAADNDVCAEGLAGEHFVLDAGGAPARGRVWPGLCHFPDFTRAQTRDWWAGRVAALLTDSGLAGLWNDMNEPSVFRTPERTLADDCVHRGLGGGPHAKFHNLYGQLMAEASREGFARARPDARPFVLTRAAHLASGRLCATWTGDNMSRWEDLAWSIPMVLNLGLSGQPFSGPDIGGFWGDPDEELFVRWFELGAFLPFCRGHSEKTGCRKEPWSFGEAALAHVRAALERRYSLLPTLYTLFERANRTGLPLARPVWFADPSDARLLAVEDAFLLGDDLLVAPVVERGARERRVVLPRAPGGWYAFPGGGHHEGDEAVVPAPLGVTPVFARAGSIVVTTEPAPHTGALDGPFTAHVFPAADGSARGALYEDAGEGFGHMRGAWRRTWLSATRGPRGTPLERSVEGSWEAPERSWRVSSPADGDR